MRAVKRLVKYLGQIEDVISALLVALLTIVVLVQVVSRLLKISLAWTTEASILIFIFIGFLGAVVAGRDNDHVRVTLIDNYVSGKPARVIATIIKVAIMVFAAFISYEAYRLGLKQSASVTPGLGLSASVYSVPLLIAGALLALHALLDVVMRKV